MVLTNAERQRRYREKLKAAARQEPIAIAEADQSFADTLRAAYIKGGVDVLGGLDDAEAQEALREFRRNAPRAADMVRVMRDAGERNAYARFRAKHEEWLVQRGIIRRAVT